MLDMEFTLLRWQAWAPGMADSAAWGEWARGAAELVDDGSSPRLEQVKPLLRRRFSRLTRMALHVAFQCLDGRHDLRTVFCSRHGEIHRTHTLLDEIVRAQPVSPMGFSLSVHNTASGLYSIASGNRAPSTAIAAGADTLEMGLIEALGYLNNCPDQPVLLVIADEPTPEVYRQFDDEAPFPHALALLLGAGEQAGTPLSLRALAGSGAAELPHSLALLRWLAGGASDCVITGARRDWRWARGDA